MLFRSIVLEPIIPKLSVHYWMETGNKERNPEIYEQLTRHIKHVQVEAKTVLGDTIISVDELLNLKTNDVIKLNQPIDQALTFVVNDEPKMLVQAGKLNNKIAVQVLEEIKEGSYL